MKITFFIVVSLFSLSAAAQFDKAVYITPIVNINIVMEGLGQNDAGIGLGLNASFFGKQKLQLLVEAGTDRFIGDKVRRIDPVTGIEAKNAIVYNFKAGTQFFLMNALSISVTYGPSWYLVRDFEFTTGFGFKYSISCYLSKDRRILLRLSITDIPKEYENIRYLAFGIGYRM